MANIWEGNPVEVNQNFLSNIINDYCVAINNKGFFYTNPTSIDPKFGIKVDSVVKRYPGWNNLIKARDQYEYGSNIVCAGAGEANIGTQQRNDFFGIGGFYADRTSAIDFIPRMCPTLVDASQGLSVLYDLCKAYWKKSDVDNMPLPTYAWEITLDRTSSTYPFGWKATRVSGFTNIIKDKKILQGYGIYSNKTDGSAQETLTKQFITSTEISQIGKANYPGYSGGSCYDTYIVGTRIQNGVERKIAFGYMQSLFNFRVSCGSSGLFGHLGSLTVGAFKSLGEGFHTYLLSAGDEDFSPNPWTGYQPSIAAIQSAPSRPIICITVADQTTWEKAFAGSGMSWSYDEDVCLSPEGDGLYKPGQSPSSGQPDNPVNPPDSGDGDNESDIIEYPDPKFVPFGAYRRYWLTPNNIPELRDFLFSETFVDNVARLWSNPLEYIVDLTYYPIVPSAINAVGEAQPLTIGNVQSSIIVNSMPATIKPYLFGGSFNLTNYYGNYLDYEPYTSLSIFLPYIGVRELDVSRVTGHRIGVWYIFDFDARIITAQISLDGTADGSKRDGQVYADFSAPFGLNFPLSGESLNERALGIINSITSVATAVGGTVAGMATGGAALAAGGAMSAGFAASQFMQAGASALQVPNALTGMHTSPKMGGTMSPMSGLFGPQTPYLIINRPIAAQPKTFATYHGLSSSYSGKVSDMSSGFLKCSDVVLSAAPTMTGDEQNMIINMLKSGIYI